MPRSLTIRVIIGMVLAAILFFGGWALAFEGNDRRNIGYVFWKAGLYKMDPERAAFIMLLDPSHKRIVLGKTERQLNSYFGTLLKLDEVSAYYRDAYDLYHQGEDVRFIRKSPWMIVFKDGKAVDMYLIKG